MMTQEENIEVGIQKFEELCQDFSDFPEIDNINIEMLAKLLNDPNMWKSGSDMKAIMCFFHNIISDNTDEKHTDGIYLNKDIKKWIHKLAKLGVSSVEGFVYNVQIIDPNINVILKVPRKRDGIPDILREYYIGTKYINTLRYIIPNFMYTLGSFYCDSPNYTGKISVNNMCSSNIKDNSPYVVYEKIPGNSMKHMISNKMLDYSEWLDIFSQLLIALEVAQRKLNYSHFDLHTGNVMVREVKEGLTYSVNLDGETITFKNKKYVPVVIDFGMSTVTDHSTQETIGSYYFERYGMMHFMVPAFDMYKFMYFSALNSDGDMFDKICKLFEFFPDDPYNISKSKIIGLGKVTAVYGRGITFSPNAWYTPLMMFKYINNYGAQVSKRSTSYIVNYDSSLYNYYNILNMSDYATKIVKDMLEVCLPMGETTSFIKLNIWMTILEKYNNANIKMDTLSEAVKIMKDRLKSEDKEKDNFIRIDNAILSKVFSVGVPSQNEFDKHVKKILNITLDMAKNRDKPTTKAVISKINHFTSFFESVSKYLLLYYTILELDIQNSYNEWVNNFMDSKQKKFYSDNIVKYRDTVRWTKSLKIYIK
jgi:hypothetical protein